MRQKQRNLQLLYILASSSANKGAVIIYRWGGGFGLFIKIARTQILPPPPSNCACTQIFVPLMFSHPPPLYYDIILNHLFKIPNIERWPGYKIMKQNMPKGSVFFSV